MKLAPGPFTENQAYLDDAAMDEAERDAVIEKNF